MKSKTMILQSQTSNKSGRAILTLTQENDLLTTKLRLYSFAALDANAKLGVYHNNQVYAGNMLFKDGAYISSLVGDFDIDADFYCAVVDTMNNNTPLLAGGTYGGFYFDDTSVITNNLDKCYSPNPITPARETTTQNTQPNCARQQPRESADESNNLNPCAGCKYKEYFYTQQPTPNNANNCPAAQSSQQTDDNHSPQNQQFQQSAAKLNKDFDLNQANKTQSNTENQSNAPAAETTVQPANSPEPAATPTIIESLIPQFEYIFKTFPECEELNTRIENSRFVTIAESGNIYCLGAIYKDNLPEYICYAVPATYNAPVPEELGAHHQWLPLDPDDPLSDGYHIVYQDAHDLKIIEI